MPNSFVMHVTAAGITTVSATTLTVVMVQKPNDCYSTLILFILLGLDTRLP